MTIFFLNVLLEKGSGYDIEHSQTQAPLNRQPHNSKYIGVGSLSILGGGGSEANFNTGGGSIAKCTYTQACTRMYACMYMLLNGYTHMHACTHIHACMHVVMHAYIYTFTS